MNKYCSLSAKSQLLQDLLGSKEDRSPFFFGINQSTQQANTDQTQEQQVKNPN